MLSGQDALDYQAQDVPLLVLDPQGHLLGCNAAARHLTGGGGEAGDSGKLRELLFGEEEGLAGLFQGPLAEGEVVRLESETQDRDGQARRVVWTFLPLPEMAGAEPRVVATGVDITAGRGAEQELQRANRALRTLSSSNQALIQAQDEEKLLAEICRAAVEEGGYRLAWVGYAEHDRQRRVRPVASAGVEEGYLETLGVTWADEPRGHGPAGSAVRTARPALIRDIHSDPRFAPWRDEATKRGYASVLSLPLRIEGVVQGGLNVYAAEPDAFGPREHEVLEELAGDLGYGLSALRARQKRQELEQERQAHMERLRQAATVFDSTLEAVMVLDAEGRIQTVNQAFTDITGYGEEEVQGVTPPCLQTGHAGGEQERLWEALLDEGSWQGEVWAQRKNGEVFPAWQTISAVHDDRGQVGQYVAVFADLSEVKQSREQLDHLAHHDPLTDLPNRRLFEDRFQHALQRAQRDGTYVAMLFLDLDRFKNINDSLGHPVGDAVLQHVAERLSQRVRGQDTVARLGGDEFNILMEGLYTPQAAASLAQNLLNVFQDPFVADGHELSLSASVGISLFPGDGLDVPTLVKNADAALHRAKEQGRNLYHFYTEELTRSAYERFSLESALRQAQQRDELAVHFQPQVDLADGAIVGAEALLRWEHPDMGRVGPDRFIPIAEDTGLIHPIGEWVLEQACRQAEQWRQAGWQLERMAVNLSGVQMHREGLVEMVGQVLGRTGLPAGCLELEITEAVVLEETDWVVAILERLRSMGIQLAIDDFGTGYSSLSYLKNLPIDKLKIDKSLVADLPGTDSDVAIIRAVSALGANLGLTVIAEGVETAEQAGFLVGEGCRRGQGYLYSAPLPAGEFTTLLSP